MKYLLAVHFPLLCIVVCVILGVYPVSLIYFFDLYSRTKEYIKLYNKRSSVHLFNLYKGSYCQRSVVMARFPEAISYYQAIGYRWYHIIPDAWYRNPFSIKWWKKFFNL